MIHAAPPPPAGILQTVKPASQGYQTLSGHRFYCRRWDGPGRFAVECILAEKKAAKKKPQGS